MKHCLKCRKEVGKSITKCDCGSVSFLLGDIKTNDEKILCACGNDIFAAGSHIDFVDRAVTSMVCTGCHKELAIETYRDEESLAYWEDEEE